MRRRRFSEIGKRLFAGKNSQKWGCKQDPTLRHAAFTRRLRCEPLEDRRMLSILMVDADVASSGDGLAWDTAYNDLQDALTQAELLNTDGDTLNNVDQIWIAQGSYKPSAELEPGDARSASFSLVDGVTLYGGFAGTETTLAERDLSAHITMLSGDLGVQDDSADNTYTVVYCGANIKAAIDGVSIIKGNADGSSISGHAERQYGGGIYNSGNLSLANSSLLGNWAAICGGGIFNNGGTLNLNNTTLSSNATTYDGGGICNYSLSTLSITNSTLSGNSASCGGGIHNGDDSTLAIANSTITGNSSEHLGGGIKNYSDIDNSVTLYNTIVAANTSGIKGPDIYGLLSGYCNLIGDGSDQTELTNGVNGNIVGDAENPIDPMLSPLQDNGGPTFTHAPLPSSPVIDAGDDKLVNSLLDQRGFLRLYGTVDIGAVEDQPPGVPVAYDDGFGLEQGASIILEIADILSNDFCNDGSPLTFQMVQGPQHGTLVDNLNGTLTYTPEGTFWGTDSFSYQAVNGSLKSNEATVALSVLSPQSVVVTTAGDEQDGDLSDGDISLREALIDLSATQIQFSADLVNQAIVLTIGTLEISNVEIVGLGEQCLTIDGNGRYTVFNVGSGTSSISHLSISGGSADYDGGGVYNSGTLTLANTTLCDNFASDEGGGIYNSGILTINNTTLSGNSANRFGGGINNYRGTLTVTNSAISSNSADNGGGISSNQGTLTIGNTTLSGNSADRFGGGIASNQGTLAIKNTTLWGNSAMTGGGVAVFIHYEVVLNNTIVAQNLAGTNPDVHLLDSYLSGAHNLIGDGSGQAFLIDGTYGNIVGTAENPVDPMLGPLQDNGGPTLTHAPLPGSPLIDAGKDSLVTDVLDQRGFLRQYGTAVDIGAVEDQPPGVPVAYNDGFELDQGGSVTLAISDILANDACNDGSPLALQLVKGPQHGTLVDNLDGTLLYTPEGTFWGTDTFSYQAVNGSLESNESTVVISVISPLSIVVTAAEDEQDGNLAVDDISLREALVDLAASQIQFSSDLVDQTIFLTMGTLELCEVEVIGLGERFFTIDGNDQYTVLTVGSGTTSISHLTISGGRSSYGGGINNSGILAVSNVALSGNSAGNGGGIYNYGTLTVTNSTFSGNLADRDGGGIFNSDSLTINNSILYLNPTGNIFGSFDGSNNLIGIDPGFAQTPSAGLDGKWGTLDDDPGALQLTGSSPAVNAGNNQLAVDSDGNPINNDLAGNPRIADDTVDVGAYEYQGPAAAGREMPSLLVTVADDEFDLYDGEITLREAIYYSESVISTGTITFDATLDGTTITLGGEELLIAHSVVIDASTLSSLTVDAGKRSRVFNIAGNVSLMGLTITGGSGLAGGGIMNFGTLTINNSTLSGNTAVFCGGVFNFGGILSITNSTISGNSADSSSSGIYNASPGTMTINNSIVSLNSATNIDGNFDGTNNLIDIDPGFVRAPSPGDDGEWGTDDDDPGDLRLAAGSPAINAGSNALAVDPDGYPLETDIAGKPRIQNGTVDIGAYEFTALPGDANFDGYVNKVDAAIVAAHWSKPYNVPGDANLDGVVNSADAAIMSANWLTESGASWADGDFNGDGRVDETDATLLAANLGSGSAVLRWEDGDFNGDGLVDDIDATIMAANWRQRTFIPPATSDSAAVETQPVSYDLDNDGQIGLGDLAVFASVYREQPGVTTESPHAYAADFDGSGTVDLGDLAIFSAAYQLGRSNGSTANSPEVSQSASVAPETVLTAAPALLPGDANSDGSVDDYDAATLANNWKKQNAATWSQGDFNADGEVTDADMAILAQHWMMTADDLDDNDDERDAVFAEVGSVDDTLGLLD